MGGKLLSVTDGSGVDVSSNTGHVGNINPLRYRGYYYDSETGFYYLNSRYYDPETGRFINADGEVNDDILGTNLFSYCGNNPVNRADDNGKGWWIVAGALIGGIVGGVSKIVSNVASGEKWSKGVLGAFAGGAVSGAIVAATGNAYAAAFAGAAVESAVNEVTSYTSWSGFNNDAEKKQVTAKNVAESFVNVAVDTGINGTTSLVTGEIAGKVVPINKGWIKPVKFKSSFIGKYSNKVKIQSLVDSGVNMGVNFVRDISYPNPAEKYGQAPIVSLYPAN